MSGCSSMPYNKTKEGNIIEIKITTGSNVQTISKVVWWVKLKHLSTFLFLDLYCNIITIMRYITRVAIISITPKISWCKSIIRSIVRVAGVWNPT
jgi:hypothetical protein